jgi:hypothetical protein
MTEFDFASIGKIACELQAPVQTIKRIADQLRIKPAGSINGVTHFHSSDVERIAAKLREMDHNNPPVIAASGE